MYQPLREDCKEIRVLSFEPNLSFDSDDQQPLRLKTQHVSLLADPAIQYNAISYCWGQNPPLKTIIMDGVETGVPASAEVALRSTYYLEEDRTVPVWIDAICINQKDVEEKGWQVAMMGDLYSKASKVLVWLGQEEDGTESAIPLMRELVSILDELEVSVGGDVDMVSTVRKLGYHSNHVLSRVTQQTERSPEEMLSALSLFFMAPWFTRLWPVQEMVRAKYSIVVQGIHSLPASIIALVAYFFCGMVLQSARSSLSRSKSIDSGLRGAFNVILTAECRTSFIDLAYALTLSQEFDTTDPRDKVYAILGLISPISQREKVIALIKPDYTRSIRDVHIHASFVALKTLNSLDPLRDSQRIFARDASGYPSLPSWMLRFDTSWSNRDRGMQSHRIDHEDSGYLLGLEAKFHSDPLHNNILHTLGIRLDEIEDSDAIVDFTSIYRSYRYVADEEWYSYFSAMWRHLPLNWSRWTWDEISLLARTCVGNTKSYPATNDQYQIVADFGALLKESKKYCIEEDDESLLKVLTDRRFDEGDAKRYIDTLRQRAYNRRLFVTKGGLVGLGPARCIAGDAVCILFSCPVPLILRREGDLWTLIGDAYVDDFMDVSLISIQLVSNESPIR